MRGLYITRILERMSRRDHLQLSIGLQRLDQPVDQLWVNQRFVALDIDYVGELLHSCRYLRNPIGAARVMARCHRDFGAPIESRFGNPEIIGGDHQLIEFTASPATFPNVPEKGFPCDGMQRLSWKTG